MSEREPMEGNVKKRAGGADRTGDWRLEGFLWLEDLAAEMPILTSSDEFPRFPLLKAEEGVPLSWDRFSRGAVEGLISRTRGLVRLLEGSEGADAEEEADRRLAACLAEGVLAELKDHPAWERSPTFYLRVLLVGLDRAASAGSLPSSLEVPGLDGAVGVLDDALANLRRVTGLERDIALAMVEDIRMFIRSAFCEEGSAVRLAGALKGFASFLSGLRPETYFEPVPRDYLDTLLDHGFGRRMEAEDLVEAMEAERPDKIRNRPSSLMPDGAFPEDEEGLVDLYRREAVSVQNFFEEMRIGLPTGVAPPRVMITPSLWRSIRSSASYVAPDLFYVTPPARREEGLMEFHREYPFITTHEAYPGHHLLDTIRLEHHSPWRRIYESPFYYEGWTCYVETLLMELGYRPAGELESLYRRRKAWRWARAWTDLNLHLGRIDLEGAARVLSRAGIPLPQARRQAHRYALTPGMQMCYFFGEREIASLREKHLAGLGLEGFHRHFLEGGQLPFQLIDERLRAAHDRDR
jgi:hypothetical protein